MQELAIAVALVIVLMLTALGIGELLAWALPF
jgi:hypothetical protein